jgi:hypothetical protein
MQGSKGGIIGAADYTVIFGGKDSHVHKKGS